MTKPTRYIDPRAQLARLQTLVATLNAAYWEVQADLKWASARPATIPGLLQKSSQLVADIEAIELRIHQLTR